MKDTYLKWSHEGTLPDANVYDSIVFLFGKTSKSYSPNLGKKG